MTDAPKTVEAWLDEVRLGLGAIAADLNRSDEHHEASKVQAALEAVYAAQCSIVGAENWVWPPQQRRSYTRHHGQD